MSIVSGASFKSQRKWHPSKSSSVFPAGLQLVNKKTYTFWHVCFSNYFSSLSLLLPSQDSQVRPNTTYSLHQPQGNKEHGTERSGYLYKKSDGLVLKKILMIEFMGFFLSIFVQGGFGSPCKEA